MVRQIYLFIGSTYYFGEYISPTQRLQPEVI